MQSEFSLPTILAAELVAQGWSINRLAHAAGLSPNVVATIVNGTTPNPGVKTVEKILGVLGRDWGWVHRQGVRPAVVTGRKGNAPCHRGGDGIG